MMFIERRLRANFDPYFAVVVCVLLVSLCGCAMQGRMPISNPPIRTVAVSGMHGGSNPTKNAHVSVADHLRWIRRNGRATFYNQNGGQRSFGAVCVHNRIRRNCPHSRTRDG